MQIITQKQQILQLKNELNVSTQSSELEEIFKHCVAEVKKKRERY